MKGYILLSLLIIQNLSCNRLCPKKNNDNGTKTIDNNSVSEIFFLSNGQNIILSERNKNKLEEYKEYFTNPEATKEG